MGLVPAWQRHIDDLVVHGLDEGSQSFNELIENVDVEDHVLLLFLLGWQWHTR